MLWAPEGDESSRVKFYSLLSQTVALYKEVNIQWN